MTEKILQSKVIRRNKEIADFNADKIRVAITKAFVAVKGEEAKHSVHIQQVIDHLLNSVLQGLSRHYENSHTPLHIEAIQDQVELILMREGHHDVARSYVLYRDERTKLRNQQTKAQAVIESNLVVTPEHMQLIQDRFDVACFNLPEVDKARLIELTLNDLYKGATREEVENATILASRVMIEHDPIYTKVTMRLLLNQVYTEVLDQFDGSPDHHKKLAQFHQDNFIRYLDKGIHAELLNPDLKTFDLEQIIKAIDCSRDNQFNFLGLQTLYDRYFLHIDSKRIETPQFFFMRVAMGLAIGEKSNKTEHAIKFYNILSKFDFMSSTPTLFNSGTLHSQLSSCYISTIADDLDSIYEGIKENALMSKWAGGIGNDWTSVRGLGARIKGTNGQSQGVVPFLKVVNDTCIAVNQCFSAETLVHTDKGLKTINTITADDLVLGISGKYRQVHQVMDYLQIGPMVELKAQSTFKPVKVTTGHPLYVLRGVNPKDNHEIIYKKLQKNLISPEWIDAGDLKVGDLIAQVIPTESIKPADYSLEDCESYGVDFAQELKQNPYAFLKSEYLHLPKAFIQAFLKGFLSQFVNQNQTTLRLECAEHTTAEHLRFFLLNVGISATCSHYKSKDKKSIANGADTEDVFDQFQLNIPITQEISFLNTEKFVKQPTWIHWNGKIYTPIESIRVIEPEVHVYDMLVEGDESYMTDLGLAHNGGKRKGSACVYLESWHLDIEEFLELRKNTGDDRRRTHDMNTANWIPDLFMKRIMHDQEWTLFSPNEVPELHETFGTEFERIYLDYEQKAERGELKQFKKIKAVSLWRKMLSMLFETGHPWMTFKDPCNIRSPQQHVGRVHSSNLCVAPETQILTDKGYFEIKSLENQTVSVWNGSEFSETIVRKTGENQLLIKVKLDNGVDIICTPYHKFYTKKNYKNNVVEKRAGELEQGDILIKYDLPLIEFNQVESFKYAYLHGYFCAKGTYSAEGNPLLPLDTKNQAVLDALILSSNQQFSKIDDLDLNNRTQYALPKDLAKKFTVPMQSSVADRLNWFAGLIDASGQINSEDYDEFLQVSAMNRDCLLKTRLMLQTLGIESRVRQMIGTPKRVLSNGNGGKRTYQATPLYRLSISAHCVKKLMQLGLKLNDLVISLPEINEEANSYKNTTVNKVIFEGRYDDTYCFTEPKRNMGMFNGILTGQCTEITLNTSADEIAVCNLGSVNLLNHLDKNTQSLDNNKLEQTITTAMRMLDNVIDINFYPVQKAKNSNMRHRPVGMGIMAFQDCLYELDISYASSQAIDFADEAQELVAYYAYLASTKLAEERGTYSTYDGSLWSKGVLPFESNQELIQQRGKEYIDVDQTIRLDWSIVKDRIQKFGMRNSNCMAIAPTATIANIIGVTSSIEPTYQNLYTKSNLSGEFLILNQYLVNDLKKHNLWNKMVLDDIKYFDGSIQKLDYVPEQIRAKYLTAFEIDANWLIECASRRQKWIDQAQSLNLYLAGVSGKKLDETYKFAWKKGLKTTYYLRTLGASHVEKSTLASSQVNKVSQQGTGSNLGTNNVKTTDPQAPKFCSIDDPDCESCQ